MSRQLSSLECSFIALVLVVGLWLSVMVDKSWGRPQQAPTLPQAPPVEAERRYDIRQNESGKWFAIVAQPGSGEFSAEEVWDVIERLNSKPTPPQRKRNCGCSSSCTCGCQDGGDCNCNSKVSAPADTYYNYNQRLVSDLSYRIEQQRREVSNALVWQQIQARYYQPVQYQSYQPMSFGRRGGSC